MIPGTTKDYYSVPLKNSSTPGCSPIYRNPISLDKLFDNKTDHYVHTAWDIFQEGKSKNPNADFLGKRRRLPDNTLSNYEFISYSAVEMLANNLGSAILHLDLLNEQPSGFPNILPIKLLGIYLPNCIEWIVTEVACNGFGFTILPIYDTLGADSIRYILELTKLTTVISNAKLALNLLKIMENSPNKDNFALKNFIIITEDPIPNELFNNNNGVTIKLWQDVINLGKDHSKLFTPATPTHVHTISFTSGTSGIPKGVLISQNSFTNTILSVFVLFEKKGITFVNESLKVYLSYLPLAHMFERCFLNASIYVSGKIGFYSGDIKAILSDFQSLKPYIFVTVPRMLQRIYDRVMNNIQQKNFITRALFYIALSAKLHRIKTTGNCEHAFYDRIVFGRLKELLGGKIKYIFVGSAPLDCEVHNCLRAFFSHSIISGYALTESSAGGFFQDIGDPQPNNMGSPCITMEFKIQSVPEFEFDATTDNPKGQLLIRGTSLASGYFNNPEATAKAFKDGWLHTGDIVERLENGAIKIVDRLKEIFKLVQGEYISPEKLEAIISKSPFISQSFVTGLSTEMFPVAIVVPDPDYAKIWAKKNNTHDEISVLCKDPLYERAILDDIYVLLKEAAVNGFEMIKQIHLEPVPFDVENGLLTTTFKLKRFTAKNRYMPEIQKLYKMHRQNNLDTNRIKN